MTVDELYDKLCDKGFREYQTGDLFSRYYVYLYAPDQEYAFRRQMTDLTQRLLRPNEFIEVVTIDIFDEFCTHLKQQFVGQERVVIRFFADSGIRTPCLMYRNIDSGRKP